MQPLTIDILIPSRGRPKEMHRVAESIVGSAANAKAITLCFFVDSDDKASLETEPAIRAAVESQLRQFLLLHGAQQGLAPTYNTMRTYTNGGIIMYAADDLEFETRGWDDQVREAFRNCKDRMLLLWARDPARELRGDGSFPDHGFVSRWSTNLLKYLFPTFGKDPNIPDSKGASFTDIWLNTLYQRLGRVVYQKDATISHAHWYTPGSTTEIDVSYALHSILTDWKIVPEYQARWADLPEHLRKLTKWIEFVARGGLEETARSLFGQGVSREAIEYKLGFDCGDIEKAVHHGARGRESRSGDNGCDSSSSEAEGSANDALHSADE